MSKALVTRHNNVPFFDRDEFLTPFDRLFDQFFESSFPEVVQSVGVKPFQGSAYPKVNVYEHDDKVNVVAEIPGISKDNIVIDVEDGVLTIKGSKHGFEEDPDATVIRKELKHSAFERKFTLGETLDGENIEASFKDGLLSISVPKLEPEKPKRTFVKIS